MFDIHHPDIPDAISRAFLEDVGMADITTEACVPANITADGRFIARQPMVVAGTELLYHMFEDPKLVKRSGERAENGDVLALVKGPARKLLTRERVALNFLQRLSGVATLARQYVDAVAGTKTRILDTRKTTPGLRQLEKMAAQAGGAQNHRMGLYDAILIKNNHITLAGGVRPAVEAAFANNGDELPVELEVRTRAEIEQALSLGVKSLLLDNMTPAQAAEEIRFINGRATVELSGGITLATVREYAEAGPDYISVGAITHSAVAVDINLRIERCN
jgi:nicotinate-nucleotide pyrophosphorylase (carboxylating)